MVYQVTGVQVLDQVAGALAVVNQVAGTQVLDQVAGGVFFFRGLLLVS